MAYDKKTWTDRLSQYATRRMLTDQDTGTVSVVDVARSEGTIYQEGDTFSADNMNDMESRINDALYGLNIEVMTLDEYNSLQEKDPTTLYLCTEQA